MSRQILVAHKAVWDRKPILRHLYQGWYRDIVARLKPGKVLEVGSGSGNLKESLADVISTDIVRVPWLDVQADAQRLPFRSAAFDGIVLFDVLHHIENVSYFFSEADRVLRDGGRLVIMDPYISWASWPVYHFVHPEPVDLRQQPLAVTSAAPDCRPFDANQAIARLVFEKHVRRFCERFPRLEIVEKTHCAFLAYPLSGGFDGPTLLPACLLRAIARFERLLWPLRTLLAFRLLVVLEKRGYRGS